MPRARFRIASVRFIARALGGFNVARDLAAVIALLTAATGPQHVLTQIVLVAAMLVVVGRSVFQVVQASAAGETSKLWMGTANQARIGIVVAAVAVDFADGRSVLAVVAGSLLCLMVVGEQAIRRPVGSAAPQSANIPGWDVPLPSYAIANRFFAATTSGMVLIVLSSVLGITQVPALLAATVSIVLAVMIGLQSVRYLVRRNRFEANLPKILKEMGPAFVFHWQAPAGTAYQATMWLPQLARLGVPYFVLVRTAANFNEIAKLTDAPIIRRSGLEDLDPVITPSLKAVFYANTAVRNSHMIRFPHLTHIQLNHGDSDKIASVSPTFRQYDKNFVAGQAAIDRFAQHGVLTRADQFEIVGRPQLEDVRPAEVPIAEIEQPTVLYSPTWSGFYDDSDYSSLRAGSAIVSAVLERACTVVFRPHPYARRHPANSAACDAIWEMLEQDRLLTGRSHVFGPTAETEMSVVDCFNASDAMISDVSSLVSDFLMSGKPLAMAAASAHGDAFVQEFPLSRAAYVFDVVKNSADGLTDLLDDMLGADSLASTRRSLRDYYLSDAPADHVAERFIETARRFI